MAFDLISSNLNKVLSINPSANVFVFGDFNGHHKNWVTYSHETDRPGELCHNFLFQTTLLRWLTFLRGSQTDASVCSAMAFPPLRNSDHAVVSVSIDFTSNKQRGIPVSSYSL